MQTTTVRRISEFSTPTFRAEDQDAEFRAEELSALYAELKTLNMAPASNARRIRQIRSLISEHLLALVVHFECEEKMIRV